MKDMAAFKTVTQMGLKWHCSLSVVWGGSPMEEMCRVLELTDEVMAYLKNKHPNLAKHFQGKR